MKYLKKFNESKNDLSKVKVKLLTTYDFGDTLTRIKSEVEKYYNDMAEYMKKSTKELYDKFDSDPSRSAADDIINNWDSYANETVWNIIVDKPNFQKSIKQTKKHILTNLPTNQENMRSSVIDLDIFNDLDDESSSVGVGDEVLILTEWCEFDKSPSGMVSAPCVIMITLDEINFRTGRGWLGVGANDSYCPEIGKGWGMFDVTWGKKVVKKETYNEFAPPSKRLE